MTFHPMTESEYAALPGLRASYVKTLDASTPAHLAARMAAPDADTDALRIGRAIHCRVLRPDDYAAEFIVSPKFDRRTKDGKAEAEAFAAAAGGRTVVTQDEQSQIDMMADAVRAHPSAGKLLAMCDMRERVVTGAIDGVRCKARIDAIGNGVLVDLKSCVSASPRAFARAVCEFGYDLQMAFYSELARQADGYDPPQSVGIIAVEKSAPYAVAVYEIRPTDLDAAYRRVLRSVAVYRDCMESGLWPAYPSHVTWLEIPAWRYAEQNNEGNDE